MPKVKERDQTDKVKGKGKKKDGGTAQQQAQRVTTAKLRKELVQQKRGVAGSTAEIPDNITDTTTGSASADSGTEAVEQVEQATHASAIEVSHSAKRGVSMVVSKVKQERQKIKERQHQPDTQGQPLDTSAPVPDAPAADTPTRPGPGRRRTRRTHPRSRRPRRGNVCGSGPQASGGSGLPTPSRTQRSGRKLHLSLPGQIPRPAGGRRWIHPLRRRAPLRGIVCASGR